MVRNVITLDVETQLSAEEVGGWKNADKMKVACVVIHSTEDNSYRWYSGKSLSRLFDRLRQADFIIGYNIKKFDYAVLQPYTSLDLQKLPTIDLLEILKKKTGLFIGLNNVAQHTINAEKPADGLQSLRWWKAGEIKKVVDYCRKDVEVTKDLFFHGKEYGEVFFWNKKLNKKQSVKVDW